MTGAELRARREALGPDTVQLARALNMGNWGFRKINDYEAGWWPVPKYIIEGIAKL